MYSFKRPSGFQYNPNSISASSMENTGGCPEFSAFLDIYVHHARNIHNICIYENQDVYAKFSLTCNPDETLSTRIIDGGGKNPVFDENLMIKVTQVDAVLKCEIWMFSRARNLMEDQLLGFALVPISQVVGKGKVTEDYSLSSTELFDSPAGTVRLTLALDTSLPVSPSTSSMLAKSSISSEVILLDRKSSEVVLDQVEYSRIEFPDISVAREHQQMVSEYFNRGIGSFLHLGASDQHVDDYEMAASSSEDHHCGSISPSGSIQNSMLLSSTTTSLSDDRNSSDSVDRKSRLAAESLNSLTTLVTTDTNENSGANPETPTSRKEAGARNEEEDHTNNEDGHNQKENPKTVQLAQAFPAALGNINVEAEQAAMQQQIVDMYMRSMQQFSESLAKMKLPMDLGKEDGNDVAQNHTGKEYEKELNKKKKDGSRVFYGSRAFF